MLRTTKMLRMRLEGYTYQEIGKKFKVSRQRVQQQISPPSGVRRQVVKKAKGRCQGCGIVVGLSGHIHHKSLALGKYGLKKGQLIEDYKDMKNLELLCISCHRLRHFF